MVQRVYSTCSVVYHFAAVIGGFIFFVKTTYNDLLEFCKMKKGGYEFNLHSALLCNYELESRGLEDVTTLFSS